MTGVQTCALPILSSLISLKENDGSAIPSNPFMRHIPMKFKMFFLFATVIGIYVFPILLLLLSFYIFVIYLFIFFHIIFVLSILIHKIPL